MYENFVEAGNDSEPNNESGIEHYLHMYGTPAPSYGNNPSPGEWNDYPNNVGSIQGYVVEFGGL